MGRRGVGAQSAAGYELATGDPVMALGGFNGSDPSPTLTDFEAYVANHQVHYFIAGGRGAGMASNDGSSTSREISSWVAENFAAASVGDVTVYDLTSSTTAPTSSTSTVTGV